MCEVSGRTCVRGDTDARLQLSRSINMYMQCNEGRVCISTLARFKNSAIPLLHRSLCMCALSLCVCVCAHACTLVRVHVYVRVHLHVRAHLHVHLTSLRARSATV